MSDEMTCPNCYEPLAIGNRCVCGWRLDKSVQIRHNGRLECGASEEDGKPCRETPTIICGNIWFCRKHFQGKSLPSKFKPADPAIVHDCLVDIYMKLGKSKQAREVLEKVAGGL